MNDEEIAWNAPRDDWPTLVRDGMRDRIVRNINTLYLDARLLGIEPERLLTMIAIGASEPVTLATFGWEPSDDE